MIKNIINQKVDSYLSLLIKDIIDFLKRTEYNGTTQTGKKKYQIK